jgi:hypothetical protein
MAFRRQPCRVLRIGARCSPRGGFPPRRRNEIMGLMAFVLCVQGEATFLRGTGIQDAQEVVSVEMPASLAPYGMTYGTAQFGRWRLPRGAERGRLLHDGRSHRISWQAEAVGAVPYVRGGRKQRPQRLLADLLSQDWLEGLIARILCGFDARRGRSGCAFCPARAMQPHPADYLSVWVPEDINDGSRPQGCPWFWM